MKKFSEATKVAKDFSLNILSDEALERIQKGTLTVLEETGIKVDSLEAIELFKKGGANVDNETRIVKIPAAMVEKALETLPSQIHVYGRGNKDFTFGDGNVRFCSFGESPQIVDPRTKEIRNVSINDVGDYAKVVDALDAHDMCWDTWVPTDVPADTYCLYTLKSYLQNTIKPICACAPNGINAQGVVDIMAAVAGNKEALKERPVGIAGTCPKSPLYLDEGICESIMVLSAAGVPNAHTSAVTAGGTGPVTLAGTIIIHHAELLASIVLSQLVSPGAPFIYGICSTALDLRKGTATFGCPEFGMLSAGLSRLCQTLGIPHVAAGNWTDSKTADMQCGVEKTLTAILPALAGCDMIFGTACLAAGMLGSLGILVADNEIIREIRRVMKGIPTEEIDISIDLIQKVGPQGNYLAEDHTVINMRENQFYPDYSDRSMVHEWLNSGSVTMAARGDEKALDILNNHSVPPLDKEVIAKIDAAIEEANKKFNI